MMRQLQFIPYQTAANLLIAMLAASICYHIAIFFGAVPFEHVWGGQLKTYKEMLVMETVSITTNLLLIWFVAQAAGYAKRVFNHKIIRLWLWLMVAVFFLNSVGNLLAISDFERWIFTPITLLSLVFLLRMLAEKSSQFPSK